MMRYSGQQAKCPHCGHAEIDREDQGTRPSSTDAVIIEVRAALERLLVATCRACHSEWVELTTE